VAETIKYSLNFQVVGGTSVPISSEIVVDAYAKIQVAVPAGATDLTINLQPDGANLAKFLLIKSSAYGDDLTYKVNTSTTPIILDGPHVFIGNGAVSILDSSPTKLLFSNDLTDDVTIDILLGRDATP
jgi:hypothetical protein